MNIGVFHNNKEVKIKSIAFSTPIDEYYFVIGTIVNGKKVGSIQIDKVDDEKVYLIKSEEDDLLASVSSRVVAMVEYQDGN
jgi:hypothetical protein